jgi:hypothetical protein
MPKNIFNLSLEDLPDLWLESEDHEEIAVADCGCRLIRDYQDSGDPAFFYCEAHRKALRPGTYAGKTRVRKF